jgi:hypothetical protein
MSVPGTTQYFKARSLPGEMYRSQLNYDDNSGRFSGNQIAQVSFKISGKAPSDRLDKRLDYVFRGWTIQSDNLVSDADAEVLTRDIVFARDDVKSQTIHETLLTSTFEFDLPYSVQFKNFEMKVYAPENVIMRHNLRGDLRPTILDNGKDGVVLVATGVIGGSAKLKIAAPLLQNPVLGSIASGSIWRAALLILAAIGGLFGYLVGIALDVVKEDALKPFARRALLRLHIIREASPNGPK